MNIKLTQEALSEVAALKDPCLDAVCKYIIDSKSEDAELYVFSKPSSPFGRVILATCLSVRHLSLMADDIEVLIKQNFWNKKGKPVITQGTKDDGWVAIDILQHDLVLHFFLQSARQNFKLEDLYKTIL